MSLTSHELMQIKMIDTQVKLIRVVHDVWLDSKS